MPDRRDHTVEETFIRLLEVHAQKEEQDKHTIFQTLEELKEKICELTISTKDMLEAYNTAQQAIKISIFLGGLLKWIGSMLFLYYSLSELLQSLHKL